MDWEEHEKRIRIECESNGKTEEIHQQMALVQNVRHEDGRYWFILRDVTAEELASAKLRSDIDFIVMMADIEL